MGSWTARAYKPGDEKGILELVKAVWPQAVSDDRQWSEGWEWLYMCNPVEPARIWIAEAGGRIVGLHSLHFMRMTVKGEIVKASQALDAMTHPDYRRQGICTTLERRVLKEAEETGAYLVLGFPVPEIYRLHMKCGWRDVCAFNVMLKPLNWGRTLATFTRLSNERVLRAWTATATRVTDLYCRGRAPSKRGQLRISELSRFDERVNDLWCRIRDEHGIISVRDQEYLNWRYVDTPTQKYKIYAAVKGGQICGYVVLGSRRETDLAVGSVFDIVASLDDRDLLHGLVAKAVAHFREDRMDLVHSKMVASTVYRKAFSSNGFIRRFRIGSGAKGRFIVYPASSDLSHAYVTTPDTWFVQLGDLVGVY